MSNYAIHFKSCHSCQIMSFMSNHVIQIKSCHSCCHSCNSCHHSCLFRLSNVSWEAFAIQMRVGWWGQKVLSKPSVDSFAVGRRQNRCFLSSSSSRRSCTTGTPSIPSSQISFQFKTYLYFVCSSIPLARLKMICWRGFGTWVRRGRGDVRPGSPFRNILKNDHNSLS
jgi:hypothetical protein